MCTAICREAGASVGRLPKWAGFAGSVYPWDGAIISGCISAVALMLKCCAFRVDPDTVDRDAWERVTSAAFEIAEEHPAFDRKAVDLFVSLLGWRGSVDFVSENPPHGEAYGYNLQLGLCGARINRERLLISDGVEYDGAVVLGIWLQGDAQSAKDFPELLAAKLATSRGA